MADDLPAQKPPNIVIAVDVHGNTYVDGLLVTRDQNVIEIVERKQAEHAKINACSTIPDKPGA